MHNWIDQMGPDFLKNGAKMKRISILTITASRGFVCNHPFLVCSVLWLVFLYRSFPFLFSLLVSASPVVVCTAVLLGTLLSLGQYDEKVGLGFDVSNSEKEGFEDGGFVGGDDGDLEERVDVVEKGIEDENLVDEFKKVDGIVQDDGLVLPSGFDDREIAFETRLREEVDGESEKFGVVEGVEDDRDTERGEVDYGDFESVENEGYVPNEEIENLERYGLLRGSTDAGVDDHVESSLMHWKRVDGDHDEDDADDDSYESGSDGVESSSPDASMTDITPLLDELHPLLESGNSQYADQSLEAFTLPPEGSIGSDDSSVHSDVNADETKVVGDGSGDEEHEDDEDDEEEEVETREVKEDKAEAAITTWTEDDQKNLMELDISELERNRRLENLIARRRARKNLGLMLEKNLIDLDGMDSFQVAPISTKRSNPFDLANDSNYGMGLPPIPGSAPSALHHRRNPFDLPYDSNEEKPDLKGDGFLEEFMEFNHDQKGPTFRRYESFNVGSSSMEFPRYEGRDTGRSSRFRPYFVTEGTAAEGINYSFQRLPSDVSESKLSSVAETESASAVLDEEESTSAVLDEEEMELIDHDEMAEETDMVSNTDQGSLLVEHGSLLSEDVDSISGNQYESRDFDRILPEVELGGIESYLGPESDTDAALRFLNTEFRDTEGYTVADLWEPEGGHLVNPAETDTLNGYSREEIDDNHHSSSGLSSLSEEYNVVKNVELDESQVNAGEMTSNSTVSFDIPPVHLMRATDSDHASDIEDDGDIRDPVYDSSPRAFKDGSSSFPSGLHSDAAIDLIPLGTEPTDLFVNEEPVVPDEGLEKGTAEHSDVLGSRLGEIAENGDHKIIEHEFSRSDQGFGDINEPLVLENVVHLNSFLSDTSVEKEIVVLDEKVMKSEEDVKLAAPVEIYTSVSEIKLLEEAKTDLEEEEDLKIKIQETSSYSDKYVHVLDNADGGLVPTLDDEVSFADKSFIPNTHGDHEEEEPTNFTPKHEDEDEIGAISVEEKVNCLQEPVHSIYLERSHSSEHSVPEEDGVNPNEKYGYSQESNQESSEFGILSPAVASIDTTVGDVVNAYESTNDDASDIKEIDEELLLELEALGDFSMPLDLKREGIYYGLPRDYPVVPELDTSEVKLGADMPLADAISPEGDPMEERNDQNVAGFTSPEPTLQQSIIDDRFTNILDSALKPQSTGHDSASVQVEEAMTKKCEDGDKTGFRYPETGQSQKDQTSVSELAHHDVRPMNEIHMDYEQHHVELHLKEPTSPTSEHGIGVNRESVGLINSPQLEELKTPALLGDNEVVSPRTPVVDQMNNSLMVVKLTSEEASSEKFGLNTDETTNREFESSSHLHTQE